MLIDFIVVGISIGMVYGIVALGISLIYSGLDVVHFAHGEVYMFGAFFSVILFRDAGMPYPMAVLGAMILAGFLGVLIERLIYRRLTREGGGYTVAGMGMIICGFGMAIVLQNLAFLAFGPGGNAVLVNFGPPIEIGTMALPMSYVWILVTAVALMAAVHLILKRTKLGLGIRAVAANKSIAYLMGINVPVMISVIFGAACAMAAIAGGLVGPINYVEVEMGYLMLIKAFAAAVVGGFGSLPGAILGGLLVGLVESLGSAFLSPNYKDIYPFLLMILVLMVRPSGLMGVSAKVKA